jgi:uncharacterized protein (DUF2062 family)
MINKIAKWAKSLLRKGMEPEKIAFCIAFGIALGIFPVLGASSLLCLLAAFALRLNLPAIQAINYLVYPLQIILIAPFYGFGGWLFGQQGRLSGGEGLVYRLQNDFWKTIADIWDLTLYAIFTWLIISPFLVLLLYIISKPLIGSFAESLQKRQSPR